MAITFEGAGSLVSSNTNAETVTIPWPSGYSPVDNDVAVVVAVGRHAGPSSVACPTPSAGSNFTVVATSFFNAGSSDLETTVFYKVLDGTETTASFTNNATFSTTGNGVGYAMAIFRGLSDVNPIDTAAVTSSSAAATTWTPTGITTTQYGALVLSIVGSADDNSLGLDSGNEQGFTARMSGASYNITPYTNDAAIGMASKVLTSTATVTMPTWRQNQNGSDSWAGMSFALRPGFEVSGGAVGSGSADRAALIQQNTATGAAVGSGSVVSDISVLFSRTALGEATVVGDVDIKLATKRTADGAAYGDGTLNATWYPNAGITPMTIDESEVPGPAKIESLPALTPNTIDGSSPPPGPILPQLFPGNPPPFNPGDPLPIRPPYTPYIYATLDDGTQLTNAFNVSWTDPLNGTGAGQLSIPADDPLVPSLTPGTRVRCWIYGVAAFTFIIENAPETVMVSQQEELGEIVRIQGRGWVAEYGAARIYPWGGVTHPLNPQQRIWSFATPNFPNTNGWTTPFSQGEQRYVSPPRNVQKQRNALVGETLKDASNQVILDAYGYRMPGENSSVYTETIDWPAPMDWQVPAAHWIWGQEDSNVVGYNYFRSNFTIGERLTVTIAASADNFYTLFLDGIPVMGNADNHLCWQEWKYTEATLEPGTYTLGAIVVNVPLDPDNPTPDINPAALICAVYERDSMNRVGNLIWRSDGDLTQGYPLPPLDPQRYDWRCLAYPAVQPGWTVGQIVRDMLDEAQARTNMLDHTLAFTANSDSDGNTWNGIEGGGSYIPGFSMAIGTTILDALNSLVDQGWIDFRIRAGTPELQIWNQGGAGGNTGVVFTEGVNVASLSVRQAQYYFDKLLVKWSGGFVEIGSNGREGYATVNAQDKEEAIRRGNVILQDIQNPDPAVLLEVEPIVGSQPYLDFSVGDYVTVTGIGLLRVMAITVDQDDMGYPSVSVELNKRWPATERAEYNLLQSLGKGSTGIKSDPMVVGLPMKIVT